MLRIAVIGAGPAGLFAGLQAASQAEITIYEQNNSPGRKLLITGSGQCNISHEGALDTFFEHYGTAGRFLRPALHELPPHKLLAFFEQRGVAFMTESGGKIFPASRRAQDILRILKNEAASRGAVIRTGTTIEKLMPCPDGFLLHTANGSEGPYNRVILAAGGASYPSTGSDGSGFRLAADAGHTIVTPRPALTDVTIAGFPLVSAAGTSFAGCTVSLSRDAAIISRHKGDLLITHGGFSGPLILDASRQFLPGDLLVPDFCGLGESGDMEIRRFCDANGRKQLRSLAPIFACTEALFLLLIETAGLDPSLRLGELSREGRGRVLTALSGTGYTIKSLGDFRRAMATAGGVSRNEINPRSMESRLIGGLFFAGEVIDIDGDTGGYNLQAAFATGALAGKSAAAG